MKNLNVKRKTIIKPNEFLQKMKEVKKKNEENCKLIQ